MEIAKTYKGSLGRAVAIAVEAHAGQFDKAGADYIDVNGNWECSNFGKLKCSVFGNNNAALLVTMMQ